MLLRDLLMTGLRPVIRVRSLAIVNRTLFQRGAHAMFTTIFSIFGNLMDVLVVSPGFKAGNDFVDVFLVYSWFHFAFSRNLPERVLLKILFPPSMPSQVRRVLPSGHHTAPRHELET